MAKAEIAFHADASAEYREAHAWYGDRDEDVAARFERAVELGVEQIAEGPLRWPRFDDTHRKLLLPRFPYLRIFREHEGWIWIVAVAHAHRRPGYWKERTIPGA